MSGTRAVIKFLLLPLHLFLLSPLPLLLLLPLILPPLLPPSSSSSSCKARCQRSSWISSPIYWWKTAFLLYNAAFSMDNLKLYNVTPFFWVGVSVVWNSINKIIKDTWCVNVLEYLETSNRGKITGNFYSCLRQFWLVQRHCGQWMGGI